MNSAAPHAFEPSTKYWPSRKDTQAENGKLRDGEPAQWGSQRDEERRILMATVIELFTSFHGRISRKSWWLATVTLSSLGIAGVVLLDPARFSFDPSGVPPPNWAVTIWSLLLVFPMTAIMVKRLNDRDWPNWLGYAYGLIIAVVVIALRFGFRSAPDMSTGEWIAFLIYSLLGWFVVINNGFLRGTRGPNRYGPDPLQST